MKINNTKPFLNAAILFTTLALNLSFAIASPAEDAAITIAVKKAFRAEGDIPENNIEVTTIDKVVILQGIVDTRLQAHKAVEIASSIDNTIDVVDSDLKVRHSDSLLTDALITAKVKGKIRHLHIYKHIAPDYDLHVETTNQEVHIFGEVTRAADVKIISEAAKKVNNVKSAKTNIRVRN